MLIRNIIESLALFEIWFRAQTCSKRISKSRDDFNIRSFVPLIFLLNEHWTMWLTLLSDGVWRIDEMWTSAVIMLLEASFFLLFLVELLIDWGDGHFTQGQELRGLFSYLRCGVHHWKCFARKTGSSRWGLLAHYSEKGPWLFPSQFFNFSARVAAKHISLSRQRSLCDLERALW